MTLTVTQAKDLQVAIENYQFPAEYFDFDEEKVARAENMQKLEAIIRPDLVSESIEEVNRGLANVIHWGNAQQGYKHHRRKTFIVGVTDRQLQAFQALVAHNRIPSLQEIADLGMPGYSKISFISKILAFLSPSSRCTLDRLVARMGRKHGERALDRLTVYSSYIPVTASNQQVYADWCRECEEISQCYYDGRPRVVDVERGFFNLIQLGRLEYATEIYQAA